MGSTVFSMDTLYLSVYIKQVIIHFAKMESFMDLIVHIPSSLGIFK